MPREAILQNRLAPRRRTNSFARVLEQRRASEFLRRAKSALDRAPSGDECRCTCSGFVIAGKKPLPEGMGA